MNPLQLKIVNNIFHMITIGSLIISMGIGILSYSGFLSKDSNIIIVFLIIFGLSAMVDIYTKALIKKENTNGI